MTMQVTRQDFPGGERSDFVEIVDDGGERMFVEVESFDDFVRRAKAGEFDRKFDPTTGAFTGGGTAPR